MDSYDYKLLDDVNQKNSKYLDTTFKVLIEGMSGVGKTSWLTTALYPFFVARQGLVMSSPQQELIIDAYKNMQSKEMPKPTGRMEKTNLVVKYREPGKTLETFLFEISFYDPKGGTLGYSYDDIKARQPSDLAELYDTSLETTANCVFVSTEELQENPCATRRDLLKIRNLIEASLLKQKRSFHLLLILTKADLIGFRTGFWPWSSDSYDAQVLEEFCEEAFKSLFVDTLTQYDLLTEAIPISSVGGRKGDFSPFQVSLPVIKICNTILANLTAKISEIESLPKEEQQEYNVGLRILHQKKHLLETGIRDYYRTYSNRISFSWGNRNAK